MNVRKEKNSVSFSTNQCQFRTVFLIFSVSSHSELLSSFASCSNWYNWVSEISYKCRNMNWSFIFCRPKFLSTYFLKSLNTTDSFFFKYLTLNILAWIETALNHTIHWLMQHTIYCSCFWQDVMHCVTFPHLIPSYISIFFLHLINLHFPG